MRSRTQFLREDLAFAIRTFRERPGFAFATLATLAVGISAATVFFGAVDSILLAPVALDEPDRVVSMFGTEEDAGAGREGMAPQTVADIGERARSLESIGAAEPYSFDLQGPDGPINVGAWIVSEGFFDVLRTTPAAGRLLGAADFEEDTQPLVISHVFWMSQFGGSREALGETLTLDEGSHTIIGVLPEDFPLRSGGREIYVMRSPADALWNSRTQSYFSAFARLAPDASLESAGAELDEISALLRNEFPDANEGRGVLIEPLATTLVQGSAGALWLLFGAAILMLVISSVNAAGLLLAHAATRSREIAIRAAVGAGQGRLVRQLLTETSLLAGGALLVSIPLAVAGLGVFRAMSPAGMPRIDEVAPDLRIALFATVIAFTVAIVVGLIPALRVARPDLYEILKPGGRSGTATPAASRLRSLLVGTEVAIAVVLLVGGGLLFRSWVQLQDTDQGYDPAGVEAVAVHYWQYHEDRAGRAEFARAVIERLRAAPGVEGASVATLLPLAPGIGDDDAEMTVPGNEDSRTPTRWLAVGPGFFEALEIPIEAGRAFTEADAPGTQLTVIVSREAARRMWPGEDAVGRSLLLGGDSNSDTTALVVGVVADARFDNLEQEPGPTVYMPHAHNPSGSVYFVARSVSPALPILRGVLAELQPALVPSPVSLAGISADAKQPRRFSLMLLSGFGLIALLLTVVGLFGHLSYSIRTREHELGVRMALGAWPGRLIRMVVRQGLALVVAGGLTGLALAFVFSRFVSALLYGIAPSDPMTFTAAALLVLGVGAAASYLPARRVSQVDPAIALRAE